MSRPTGVSCSIFVGNVPYDAQEDELRELFAKVGNVTSVRVVCDKDTKQPKGYAFCDFSDTGAVQAAIEKLNNVEYNGRKLRIDWAERELHTPLPRAAEERPGTLPRPGAPPPPGGDPLALPAPVPSVADRLARIREQEAAEQARVAAADAAERAEIARLVETLTPVQLFNILGEMQRLVLRAPEVARALVNENVQLALALQHAEFLVGLIDEAPLPTEAETKERARQVKACVWPPPPTDPFMPSAAGFLPQGAQPPDPSLLALPGAFPTSTTLGGGSALSGANGVSSVHGLASPCSSTTMPLFGSSGPLSTSGIGTAPNLAAVAQPPPAQAPQALAPSFAQDPRVSSFSAGQPMSQAAATAGNGTGGARQNLLEHLVTLSPSQIDQLPHGMKVQLLDFLQTLPTPQGTG